MNLNNLTDLNEVLKQNPRYQGGELKLDHYLVLLPANETADDKLNLLEDKGYLPHTVSWLSKDAWKVRLYHRAEGLTNRRISIFGMQFGILTGDKAQCTVSSPYERFEDYRVTGDESMLEDKPAALPEKGLMFLKMLDDLGGWEI
jgi:hypothetical protein